MADTCYRDTGAEKLTIRTDLKAPVQKIRDTQTQHKTHQTN